MGNYGRGMERAVATACVTAFASNPKPFLDTVSTGSGSDLVSDQHEIFLSPLPHIQNAASIQMCDCDQDYSQERAGTDADPNRQISRS